MRLAVISDSHIPNRANEIPEPFREHIKVADHTIHAGDVTSETAYDMINELAHGELTAVSGNMDPPVLSVPQTTTVSVEDVTFVVTHGTGDLDHYEQRVAQIARNEAGEPAIGISGHTHEVLDTSVGDIRLLNPGSVTGASPATRTTMMTVDVEKTDIQVTVHEL